MLGLYPSLARRQLLLSTIACTVGAMIPLSSASAEGTPSAPPPAPAPVETLSPTAHPSTSVTGGSGFIAATVETAQAPDQSIRPFTFHATDEQLADLKRRVRSVRWPSRELVKDVTQGVQLATMQKLADYWANQYDWRKIEGRMNALPMFLTNIDGIDIHFIHVKSKHPNALPIIVTHGWPGSVVEQLKIIDPLVNPTAHGGKAEDAFDVVIPSLPGYGFSGKPTDIGWEPTRIAKAWTTLMDRLGYTSFVASGGDWATRSRNSLPSITPTACAGST